MKITIFGSGYVGLVTGACMAETGNDVVCVDVDADKIERLNNGDIPIYEPHLEPLIKRNAEAGRLEFTTDVEYGVNHGLFQFIAVGTPPDEDGSADLQYVLAVANSIGENMNDYRIVIDKSTVPVGTADKVRETIRAAIVKRGVALEFDVVSNPEFLKEGAAIDDFMKPDRIVVGTDNPRTSELLKALYEPFNRNHDRLISMDIRSAELTKYAANAMLATKISFMNELANIAEHVGADIERVRVGIGSDPRIGYQFIYPGAGYGGSCFPKDVSAFIAISDQLGVPFELLKEVERINAGALDRFIERIREKLWVFREKKIAMWGLAFKPDTDDTRESVAIKLAAKLIEEGAEITAYDPQGMDNATLHPGVGQAINSADSALAATEGAEALIIATDWPEFASADFDKVKENMTTGLLFDGRNLLDPRTMREQGFDYHGIGRGAE